MLRISRSVNYFPAVRVALLILPGLALFSHLSLAVESDQNTVQSDDSQAPMLQLDETVESPLDDAPDEIAEPAPSEFVLLPSFERIHKLIAAGAPQLAHSLLIASRSEYESADNFNEWELLFFKLAFELQDYQGIIERADQLGEIADYEVFVEIQMYAVRAQFKLRLYADARQRLRNLIWNFPYRQENLIIWREWIAKSYIDEGMLNEAVTALTAYYLDYRPNDSDWEYRYARVLFLSGDEDEAVKRLEALQSLEARLLRLYSQYKRRDLPPAQIQQAAFDLEPQLSNSPHLLKELWAIIELNARSMQDFEMQIIAIETALSLKSDADEDRVHFSVVNLNTVEQLLAAYREYALVVGNEFNLVVGDDASWLQLAYEFEITSATTARAIYSFLASQTSDPQIRSASIFALANMLGQDGLVAVMEKIFIDQKALPVADLSESLQNSLSNRAIRRGDYADALVVMNAMKPPQTEEQTLLWLLRRARLAIFIDDFDQGDDRLNEAIGALAFPTSVEAVDQIKQVLFDLQEKGQHDLAIALFQKLYRKTADVDVQREILRWVADSLDSQASYAQAADILLRSASLGDTMNDEWGKSSMLKAGDVLVDAGLFKDARSIYTQLEQITLDPRAKAVIRSRLRKLPEID